MKRICLISMIFLFCSGFLGIDSWYEKYGLVGEDFGSVDIVPKLIPILKSNNSRDAIKAGKSIAGFKQKASAYFPDLVNIFYSDIPVSLGHNFIAAMNAALSIYNGDDKDNLEKLFYLGITHPNNAVRNEAYRNLSKAFVYSARLEETLDSLSRSEPDLKVRRLIINALGSVRYNHAKLESSSTMITSSLPSRMMNNVAEEANQYSVAVIIGNMDYVATKKSVPNVDFAINDAREIRDFLAKVKGYKEGNIIYLENATQADMVSTFGNKDNFKGKLFNWVRPESDVFVYYSGHGAPSLKDGTGYLLPVDADPSTVELNGYPLDTLYQNIAKLPAKSVTLVIDACFSGSSQSGTVTKNASSISLRPITMPTADVGVNVLSAANVNEIASWDMEAQHSLFTSYFIKALSGAADKKPYGNEDRRVDLAEVKNYVNAEVTYAARRNYGRDQNPQISGNPGFVFSSLKE